jgi:hypothetical protein
MPWPIVLPIIPELWASASVPPKTTGSAITAGIRYFMVLLLDGPKALPLWCYGRAAGACLPGLLFAAEFFRE